MPPEAHTKDLCRLHHPTHSGKVSNILNGTLNPSLLRSAFPRPIHCIVWAKHMYATLFGPPDEDNVLGDLKMSVADAERE